MPPKYAFTFDSSPPSTPDRSSRNALFAEPSTTPAGPPPPAEDDADADADADVSFTPAGAPSASYLGSSMMRGVTGTKPLNFGNVNPGSSSKNLFSKPKNQPLARSTRSVANERQPSRLSKTFLAEDEPTLPQSKPVTFSANFDDDYSDDEDEDEDENEDDDEEEDEDEDEEQNYDDENTAPIPQVVPQRSIPDNVLEDDDAMADADAEEDVWLNMQQEAGPEMGDESDLMMLATPAANERMRKEAEDMFRMSAVQSGVRRTKLQYASMAKNMYSQMGYASVTESPDLVLRTEALVNRLYDEGVDAEDNDPKLSDTLADIAGELTNLWADYKDTLSDIREDHAAEIGPGPNALPFENALYLSNLTLQLHHTRITNEMGGPVPPPLPEALFMWMEQWHNLYPSQIEDVNKHRPSPASHGLYWQTVFMALLRGRVAEAQQLLRTAGWTNARARPGETAYTSRALQNILNAVQQTCDMLENCPGATGDWDIYNSNWILFRIRAKGAFEDMRRFAEGDDMASDEESDYGGSGRGRRGRQSMAALSRKAQSKVPWDVYENLIAIFDIVLGSESAILQMAQDWCEATLGLLAWWDEGRGEQVQRMSQSQALKLASDSDNTEAYLDRLSSCLHTATRESFQINSLSHVEVGMACAFEGNFKAVIAILRGWSLPVASAVTEIASLGRWLPTHERSTLFGMESLDMEDLEVLGVNPEDPDEIDGIKDNTLIQYAQALANYDRLAGVPGPSGIARDGWELAIQVLGRMDSPERSEETVGELIQTILQNIDADSTATVDKIWALLNQLGMINFAEESAETFGDVLARDSRRYGEAMWYYALAHRPNKVREVMNLLISYSLLQSTAFPPTSELDDHLNNLLSDRTATLKQLAQQDLEAAELLGKMLSGYATLRLFYDVRDQPDKPLGARKQLAAAALVAVVASADDNIRGGLYDGTRDAVVSEDFVLALLAEASVFVDDGSTLALAHVDALLKAVEDVQTVGPRVYDVADDFFNLVLASAQGLKGSTPADLMKQQGQGQGQGQGTGGGGGLGGSFMLTGESMLASQLHREVAGLAKNAKRGWDWRQGVMADTSAEALLRKIRLGLSRDLARLWVADADGMI